MALDGPRDEIVLAEPAESFPVPHRVHLDGVAVPVDAAREALVDPRRDVEMTCVTLPRAGDDQSERSITTGV